MKKDRLLRLAKHLRELELSPEQQFDMSDWKQLTECGTACCAIGYAADIFWSEGFTLEGSASDDSYAINTWCPVYETEHLTSFGWIAVKRFFGLETEEAKYLFSKEHYGDDATPDMVASRIEDICARQERNVAEGMT